MPYQVFETNDEGVNALQEDDIVSRQTLVIKDGEQWDVDGKVVLVDGSEDAIERAEELIEASGGSVSEIADEIKSDIDDEEENAAAGMGAIFG